MRKKIDNKVIFFWVILFLGFLNRVIGLGIKSIYVDEAVTIYTCFRPLKSILPFMMHLREVHPPFYFWFVRIWMDIFIFIKPNFISYSAYMRFSSVVFAMGNIYITFLLAKKFFLERVALLSTFLIAISSFHMVYSQELRMYPMLLFFIQVSFYSFILLVESPGFLNAFLYILSTTLALFTHYYSFYMVLIEILWLLYIFYIIRFFNKEDDSDIKNDSFINTINILKNDYKKVYIRIKWIFVSFFISLFPFLFWIPYFIRQTKFQDFSLRMKPNFGNFLTLFTNMVFGETLLLGNIFSYILALLPLFMIVWLVLKDKKIGNNFFLIWLIVPLFITFIFSMTSFRIFEYKYFFIIVPPLWILLSAFLFSFNKKKLSLLILSGIIILNVLSSYNFHTNPLYQGQDWKGVSKLVSNYMTLNDRVIVHPSMMAAAFAYYFKDGKKIIPMDKPDITRLSYLYKNSEGVWVVTTVNHPFVRKSGLLNYLDSIGKRKIIARFESYNSSNLIEIYYFTFYKEDHNKK